MEEEGLEFLTPLMNSPLFRFLIRHDITVAASVIDQRPITDFPRATKLCSLPRSTFKMISHHLKRLRLALIYSTRLRRTTELNPTQTDRHKSMLLSPTHLSHPLICFAFVVWLRLLCDILLSSVVLFSVPSQKMIWNCSASIQTAGATAGPEHW